ncbi:MAG: hypothetical protein IKP61_07870 [Spirochaetales bacterium]|nr:hypothetical protein [Spirochaetales bacterium]
MKRTLASFLLSLLINAIGLVVNLINFNSNKRLLLAFSFDGGNIQKGFGWIVEHSKAIIDGESFAMHGLTFSLPNLLLFVVTVFALFYIVFLIIGSFKDKSKKA